MRDVRVWEYVTRNAALGLRFWDSVGGTALVDGLQVEVFPRANPQARKRAFLNRSGVYVAHAVPGLRDYEFGVDDPLGDSPPRLGAYRVEVRDPAGRFLPVAFDAELPARGIYAWRAPWLSPPRAIVLPTEAGSPPAALVERIPLFSAPTRPLPDPLGAVYAQLREDSTGVPAAWCLLGVSIDTVLRGLGLSDREGRVAVMFPFPEPPRRSLTSPPEARNDFTWEVALVAFRSQQSPPREPAEIPDLSAILESLETPVDIIESRLSPPLPHRLTYRQALTVRTAGAAGADASYLFISA